MNECLVCRGKRSKAELVSKVFELGGRFVLVEGNSRHRLPTVRRAHVQQRHRRTHPGGLVERRWTLQDKAARGVRLCLALVEWR